MMLMDRVSRSDTRIVVVDRVSHSYTRIVVVDRVSRSDTRIVVVDGCHFPTQDSSSGSGVTFRH